MLGKETRVERRRTGVERHVRADRCKEWGTGTD